MVDIDLIKADPAKYKKAVADKGFKVDIDELLRVNEKFVQSVMSLMDLRKEKNKFNKEFRGLPSAHKKNALKRMKEIDLKEEKTKEEHDRLRAELLKLQHAVPNPAAKDVPVGKDERDNKVFKPGKVTKLPFKALDHVELGKKLDLIDIERGVKISGSRFYFLKNEAVQLEFALVNFVFDLLSKEGFKLTWAPVLVKQEVMAAGGYLEHGSDFEIYHLPKDNLYLVGTSEQAMVGYHAAEILDEKSLPERYAIFSPCFRREAGSYGKDIRGIFRVHQFDKVEMFSYTKGEVAESDKEHEYFLSLEEKIMKALKIPYRVVKMCTGDLGLAFSRKYDIDAWMPGRGDWGEVTSTSTATDFQARRAQTRYRDKTGKTHFVHTVNGTAVAIPRMLIAILENYQQKDGSVKVPAVLQKYVPFKEIKPKV